MLLLYVCFCVYVGSYRKKLYYKKNYLDGVADHFNY